MPPPIIILHKTQLGENIGMCARAMLNCGLDQMRLVAPRDGWPNPSAIATAADADIVLNQAECFDSIEDATADCHRVYATTARTRSQAIPNLPIAEAVQEIRIAASPSADAAPTQAAIIFGPEASGLDNDTLSRADTLIHFPMNPQFSSLNLAQAVLLFGWEWLRAVDQCSKIFKQNSHSEPPALKQDLIYFLDRLENELEADDFFLTADLRPETVRKLRSIFTRSNPSEQELRMLHGVITALKK